MFRSIGCPAQWTPKDLNCTILLPYTKDARSMTLVYWDSLHRHGYRWKRFLLTGRCEEALDLEEIQDIGGPISTTLLDKSKFFNQRLIHKENCQANGYCTQSDAANCHTLSQICPVQQGPDKFRSVCGHPCSKEVGWQTYNLNKTPSLWSSQQHVMSVYKAPLNLFRTTRHHRG